MPNVADRNFWIGVVSRSHVQVGIKGGFIQINHGKKAPLQKFRAGDGLIMYSPRTSYPDGDVLQAFTAIGLVVSVGTYQVEMTPDLPMCGAVTCHEKSPYLFLSPNLSRIHVRQALSALAFVLATASVGAQQPSRARVAPPYVPGATWERRDPAAAGMDPVRLTAAIEFAQKSDAKAPRDMEESHYRSFGREPFGQGIGPFKPRGEPSGVVVRGGYVVASWGEPDRVDMTHSVTKSFLSATVGMAFDRGLIRSVRDTVWKSQAPIYALRLQAPNEPASTLGRSMFIDPFDTPHNRTIIWDDLLRQTSDWEGTLWGKPEWADRPSQNPAEWMTRARKAAGSAYEYNDVRVNVLALAATNVWRRPLPEVLRENLMDPIGASSTWRWFGYDNAWITLDGRPAQVVSGGGHWGGGMFINAWDMARFGLLTLRRGLWGDKRILSEDWVRLSLTPTVPEPTYGYMNWFLNTDRKWMPNAPASAFGHVGNGTNLVFVSPEQDLVVVVRWIENGAINEFLGKMLAAVTR